MNKIEIEIPDGKVAKWVNGVLTLVDKEPQDITERIKTFEDACNMLGDEHPQDVWHEASEMPKEEEWILIQYDEDSYDALVFCDMNADIFCACCKKCGSIRWAYVKDLLPK